MRAVVCWERGAVVPHLNQLGSCVDTVRSRRDRECPYCDIRHGRCHERPTPGPAQWELQRRDATRPRLAAAPQPVWGLPVRERFGIDCEFDWFVMEGSDDVSRRHHAHSLEGRRAGTPDMGGDDEIVEG